MHKFFFLMSWQPQYRCTYCGDSFTPNRVLDPESDYDEEFECRCCHETLCRCENCSSYVTKVHVKGDDPDEYLCPQCYSADPDFRWPCAYCRADLGPRCYKCNPPPRCKNCGHYIDRCPDSDIEKCMGDLAEYLSRPLEDYHGWCWDCIDNS